MKPIGCVYYYFDFFSLSFFLFNINFVVWFLFLFWITIRSQFTTKKHTLLWTKDEHKTDRRWLSSTIALQKLYPRRIFHLDIFGGIHILMVLQYKKKYYTNAKRNPIKIPKYFNLLVRHLSLLPSLFFTSSLFLLKHTLNAWRIGIMSCWSHHCRSSYGWKRSHSTTRTKHKIKITFFIYGFAFPFRPIQ